MPHYIWKRILTAWRMRYDEHVTHTGDTKDAFVGLVQKPKQKYRHEAIDLVER
jgi:hypothetical protein